MDAAEFRKRGKEMVDFIADHMENVPKLRVTTDVQPGGIINQLPQEAPEQGEDWSAIMADVNNIIIPGLHHFQHPQCHSYFPLGYSYESILGTMLQTGLATLANTWAGSPAGTELEMVVLDWVGKMIGVPNDFLHESGVGGGVIEPSASESILVALLAARHAAIRLLRVHYPFTDDGVLLSKLVAYTSVFAHSSMEKACMISFVQLRQLEADENYTLRGSTLKKAIIEDRRMGLIPFFVMGTLGSTSCASFDDINELGNVSVEEGLWLHVDAAYAGSSFICPEFKYLLHGIENVNSLEINAHKWLLTHLDCSLLWVKDKESLTTALSVDALYLKHKNEHKTVDFRNWGIALSRSFRAMKLWCVIRSYGVDGIRAFIREHIRLAKMFEKLVLMNNTFEVLGQVTVGLVCFRLKGSNSLNQALFRLINDSGKLHMTPSMINDRYVIRFVVCYNNACAADVNYAWKVISSLGKQLLSGNGRRVHKQLMNVNTKSSITTRFKSSKNEGEL